MHRRRMIELYMRRTPDMQICISGHRHQMVEAWHCCRTRHRVAIVPNKTMSAFCSAGCKRHTKQIRCHYGFGRYFLAKRNQRVSQVVLCP